MAKRQKTNVTSKIPLLRLATKIIERYKDHPQCQARRMVLPALSNQNSILIKRNGR